MAIPPQQSIETHQPPGNNSSQQPPKRTFDGFSGQRSAEDEHRCHGESGCSTFAFARDKLFTQQGGGFKQIRFVQSLQQCIGEVFCIWFVTNRPSAMQQSTIAEASSGMKIRETPHPLDHVVANNGQNIRRNPTDIRL